MRAHAFIGLAPRNSLARRRLRGTTLLTLSALGVTFLLSACGSSGSGNAASGDQGGTSGRAGSDSTGSGATDGDFDADTLIAAADEAAAMSEDELSAALAAADLDGEMALAEKSGLVTELGSAKVARGTWAGIGTLMKVTADQFAAGTLFGTPGTLSAPNGPLPPGVHLQATGDGGLGEAFGAGWLGGSLFNAFFVQSAINDYANGKSGIDTNNSPKGDVKATAGLSDTLITLDATAEFTLGDLSATIQTHSGIPCPDANGLMTIDSSLDVTGKAGNAFQSARFTFELTVEVDDDAQLTGRNQLKSNTKTHTADSSKGYDVTNGSVDVSMTEFADGHFGDAKGSYKGMTNDEATGWLHAGMFSGMLYRDQLLPQLQKMLDAGRCVDVTVEPSAGPMNLQPFTNVDLLTKPRAKVSNSGVSTGGTVQAKFKVNAGGSIAEAGDKVSADATFHYIAPLEFSKTETVTFEARSKRGTGKLDYTLTTSPHAE